MPDETSPILYLASAYPALSHTFVLREVAGLRAEGRAVATASIRKTSGDHIAGAAEAAEARDTFNVIETARSPALVSACLSALARPGPLLRAITLAARIAPGGVKAALWHIFYLIEAIVLADHMRKIGARHLHVHFANAGCTVAMLASELSGVPFSFTLHGPSIFFEPRRQALGEKIARAAFVACISDFCRSQGMIFADPRHWQKMEIVHCGVMPDRYGRSAEAGDGARLVFVGRLAAVKGIPMLLDAVARLVPDRPDLHLTLIGDGDDRAALEARTAALGIADHVTFTGARTQEQVADALAEADLFVLPSFAEGVPVVLMEAMASRLPVIATAVAGIPELVETGVSGHIVPPGNVEALTAAIATILQASPEERRAMGAAGRLRVEDSFDISREAAKIGRLIERAGS